MSFQSGYQGPKSPWWCGIKSLVVWHQVAAAATHRVATRSRAFDPLCGVDHVAEVEQVVGQRVQQRDAAHFVQASDHKLVHGAVGLEVRVNGFHRRAAQRFELECFRR